MGAMTIYGALSTGGGLSLIPTLPEVIEERSGDPRWQWQARGLKTWKDRNKWKSLWSFGCRVSGGDLEGYAITGDLSESDPFEPFSCDGEGTQTVKFIKGTCLDSVGAPIANAIVQGFRTADEVFVGQVTAAEDGTYVLGTENGASVAHYLVAYKAGAPDVAGTTVNTLLPTNIDGT